MLYSLLNKLYVRLVPAKWQEPVRSWLEIKGQRLWLALFARRSNASLRRLRRRVQNGGGPVRVAFLQMYVTSNQDLPIFDKMLADKRFDPYFIVYPDYYRNKSFADEMYDRTRDSLVSAYGIERVLSGRAGGKYMDYTGFFDLMVTNNPYENMTPPVFRVPYWTRRGVPSFYISYFYMGRCYVTVWNLKMLTLSCFWRIFAENKYVIDLAKKYQAVRGRNCVLTGCPKMDDYPAIEPTPRTRKRILVAPHHTIEPADVSVGCFMEYANHFLELVRKFPQVDFVFRPHPQMWQKLRGLQRLKGLVPWGNARTDAYIAELEKEPNLIMSNGGSYLQEFADSDALIHDCGSFLAEYLYTGKPCAYVYRSTIDRAKTFQELGEKCINAHYVMHNHEDVERFVEEVVLGGKDEMRGMRESFAKSEIMVNYPHASDTIMAHLKQALGME